MSTSTTICLFFSDTGGGHRSAAEAVQAGIQSIIAESAFKEKHPGQLKIISENIIERSHFINQVFVELYNFLLRHNQACMKYYYSFVNQFRPNNSEIGYRLVKSYLQKLFNKIHPDLIVSIHPMSNHYLARALKEFGFTTTRLIIVVTDPNEKLWQGWACPEADLTIVPNEAAKNKLLSWGVPENKIEIVGMPVHPDFLQPPSSDREKFLRHLNLDPKTFTLCINAGWAGGGNMRDIYRALNQVKKKIQVIFLCGNHHKLYKKVLEQSSNNKVPTRVLPFHDNMSELMNAVDLMVTKAGGLTTFEAIARRLPMAIDIITEPMPQEAGTIDILLEASKEVHLAQIVKKPEDIVQIVEGAELRNGNPIRELPSYQSLDRVDAVYDIAKIILSHIDYNNSKINQFKMQRASI